MRWAAGFGGVAGVMIACTTGWAIDANALALRSNGSSPGHGAWTLLDNGYVGTYVSLPAPGSVTVTVNAIGLSTSTPERMNVVVGDARMGWDVSSAAAADYAHTFDLPAGTHLVRAEFANNRDASALVVNSLNVNGAAVSNSSTSANALAAAETYTQNYRKGGAAVQLPTSYSGAQFTVRLKSHAFNFGVSVPGSVTDTLLIPNPAPNTDAARFQQALRDNNLNSLSPENGGKWDANEGTRDTLTALAENPAGPPNLIPYMDRISDYADDNGMRYRAHNVIWGRNPSGNVNQQPGWSDTMVQNPTNIDPVSGKVNSEALRDEISERIQYYIADRADRFYEVDVYNESYHTGSNQGHATRTYWELYEPDGIARIYKEAKDASGPNAAVFVNEYSVLQGQDGDLYANWYARHIEEIQDAGHEIFSENVVEGIGFQYYYGGFGGEHNPARIYAAMNNLAVQGMPMHLTEWGATGGSEATAANVLQETTRLVFGMPGTTGMTLWNLRNTPGTFAPVGTLYNQNWTLRQTGTRWQELMAEWSTLETPTVGLDGMLSFDGFYGDYELVINGHSYPLTLVKGTTEYVLNIPEPNAADFNFDDTVDGLDLVAWKNNFSVGAAATHAQGDADGDQDVDGADLLRWQQQLGVGQKLTGPTDGAVPEPSTAVLLLLSVVLAAAAGRSAFPD